ncbi:MAG: hypothetical protein LBG43_01710 [Treponema sp.]|nr:hypothetical protein [Treponema sp.]
MKRPRAVLKRLREVYGYGVQEKWSGVYIITDDVMATQTIEVRKLDAEGICGSGI